MLRTHPAKRHSRKAGSRVGLALAGGGPLGGLYEIGGLLALQDALEGVDLNDLDLYVGVSSGSVLAASLANGVTPAQLHEIFIDNASREHPVTPQVFLTPAFREYWQRAASVPPLLAKALLRYLRDPLRQSMLGSLQSLSRALPTGIFDNAAMGRFLADLFTAPGRTNDFRRLRRRLYVVATELDTAESVEFGAPGFDHVPISLAVQGSTALPGLFAPVRIDGHHFVDGALKKTLHASVALREGANLVLCVNPLVPYDANSARRAGRPGREKLVEGGLPVVLSQTFRALIHSRMQVGMAAYETAYKDADVLLFEPDPGDGELFFANVFSYGNRRRVCDHAYRHTLFDLGRRRGGLDAILARHGVRLRTELLDDPHASLATSPALGAWRMRGVEQELQSGLEALGHWLEAHGAGRTANARHP